MLRIHRLVPSAALMLAAISTAGVAFAAGSAPVTVVNSPSNPVPVTGSTTVSGSVAATQAGTWNVGITGNMPANPLFVTETASTTTPFQIRIGSKSFINVSQFSVPAKKRLVIEYVSYTCEFPVTGPGGGFIGAVGLATTVGGVETVHWIPHNSTEGFTGTTTFICVTGRPTRIYADPGTTVIYQTFGSIGLTDISISGSLIDSE